MVKKIKTKRERVIKSCTEITERIDSAEDIELEGAVIDTLKVINKRGRPAKKRYTECDNVDISNLKVLKHLGWCPTDGCTCSITSGDYVNGCEDIVRCIRCGNRCLLMDLLKEEKKGSARLSSRERRECLEEMSDGISFENIPDIPETFTNIDLGDDWD